MRHLLLTALLAATALVGVALNPSTAAAATHSPCTRHSATTPYVLTVNNGVTTLQGAGDIGGCPSSVATEGVTIRVCLQHLDVAGWTDQACADASRSWNRYSRFARQAGASVTATCTNGDWRTRVTGGDGWDPTEWASPVRTFLPGDSGVCGSYGGGD